MTTRELITNAFNLIPFSEGNKAFISNSNFYYEFVNLEGTLFNKQSDKCENLLNQFNLLGWRNYDDLNKELEKCPVIKLKKLNNQQILFLIAMYEKNGNAFIMRLQQVSPGRIKALLEGLKRYATSKSDMGQSVRLLITEIERVWTISVHRTANKLVAKWDKDKVNEEKKKTYEDEKRTKALNDKKLKGVLINDDINF